MARSGPETVFAELLSELVRVERVSVDSHFFDDLGADSLVMAHFCARVRKRGNLPRVSMRDVYRHPTIRSLAAAVAEAGPAPAKAPAPAVIEPPTPTSRREYVVCGALQLLFFLGYSYVAALGAAAGQAWISAGSDAFHIYVRSVLFGIAGFLVV